MKSSTSVPSQIERVSRSYEHMIAAWRTSRSQRSLKPLRHARSVFHIAMALVEPSQARLGNTLRVNVHNEMRDAIVVEDSLYDPGNARARL